MKLILLSGIFNIFEISKSRKFYKCLIKIGQFNRLFKYIKTTYKLTSFVTNSSREIKGIFCNKIKSYHKLIVAK